MIQITSTNDAANRNPGIVPPWLTTPPTAPSRNPGIVPPWLLQPITILPIEDEPFSILPIDEVEEYHILPVGGETQFVPVSIDASPASMIDALRGR